MEKTRAHEARAELLLLRPRTTQDAQARRRPRRLHLRVMRRARSIGHSLGTKRPDHAKPAHTGPAGREKPSMQFCGKHRHQLSGLASTVDNPHGKLNTDAAICSDCLTLCREIHAEQLT